MKKSIFERNLIIERDFESERLNLNKKYSSKEEYERKYQKISSDFSELLEFQKDIFAMNDIIKKRNLSDNLLIYLIYDFLEIYKENEYIQKDYHDQIKESEFDQSFEEYSDNLIQNIIYEKINLDEIF